MGARGGGAPTYGGGRSPNCQLGFAVNRKVDKQERGDL